MPGSTPSRVEIDNLGIPPLAGICSYAAAARPGLPVEQTVLRLKRCNYVLRRLHDVGAAHLAATPEWEVKCGLSLHVWLDAEHASALQARIAEMREPPLGLDTVPDERLEAAFEELIRAGSTVELLAGSYAAARHALVTALADHLELLNPLFDHPTRRLLRTIVREQEEMLGWGRAALDALASGDGRGEADRFATHVVAYLAAAGGVSGADAVPADSELPEPRWDGTPFEMDAEPRRDHRFADAFNATAKIDEYWRDESRPADERVWALAYKRLREMDVPEWIAPIIGKTRGKPWAYYNDLSRQLWDEARHAMMGEVAIVALGVPFYEFPIDWASSVSLNREFTPLEAHIVLWRIEQGLMPGSTGKRREWVVAHDHGDDLLAALQDYDWADEVLHAQIGRRWLADAYPSRAELTQIADELMERWEARLDYYAGLSTGRDWWPEFVSLAREHARLPG